MTETVAVAKKEKDKTVTIKVNRREVKVPKHLTGAELLEIAGFAGSEWDLLKLAGEGDASGGTLIKGEEQLTVHKGDRFRVVPGNRTFGQS